MQTPNSGPTSKLPRLDRVFEKAPGFLFVLGPDLAVQAANDSARAVFGEPTGKRCHQHFTGRADGCLDCPVVETFADGEPRQCRQVYRTPEGQQVPVAVRTTAVRGAAGEVVAVVVLATDQYEQKLLEEELTESRERLRLLFEEVPCYISVQDRDLRIVQAKRQFKEDFGDQIGAHCYDLYKHRTKECLNCPVARTFADGQTHHSEEVVTSLTGRQIHTLVSTAALPNAHGEIDTVMEMSADITGIRELQGQLTNLGLLVGSMSHGLKGLLTGLDGGSYLISSGLKRGKQDRIEQGRSMIQRNLRHLRSVVRDLLFLAGEEGLAFEQADLAELARGVVEPLRKRAADLDIELQVEIASDVGHGEVDPKALSESLQNLLEYAFEACRRDGAQQGHLVRYALSTDGDNALFHIEDDGIGMDRETREKAFSPFFSSEGGGSGAVGLFTASKVIERHRGIIEVESTPGQGCSLHIRIPLTGASNPAPISLGPGSVGPGSMGPGSAPA